MAKGKKEITTLKIIKNEIYETPRIMARINTKTHNYISDLAGKSGRRYHEVLAKMVEFAYKNAVIIDE